MSMFECHSCRRYIRITEARCPFCATKPESIEAPLGLGTLIFALGLSLAACGGKAADDEADSTEATSESSSESTSSSTNSTTTDESEDSADAYTVSGNEWESDATVTDESEDSADAYTVSGNEWETTDESSEWESSESESSESESSESESTDESTDTIDGSTSG
jgi:hypothetical protein